MTSSNFPITKEWFEACETGNIEEIKRILALKRKYQRWIKRNDSLDALGIVIQYNHLEAARVLLEAGLKPDGPASCHALARASRQGKYEMVKLLMEFKANPNGRGEFVSEWPLFWAANNGYSKIVKLLLDHGAAVHDAHGNCATKFFINNNFEFESLRLMMKAGGTLPDMKERWVLDNRECIRVYLQFGGASYLRPCLVLTQEKKRMDILIAFCSMKMLPRFSIGTHCLPLELVRVLSQFLYEDG